MTYIAFRVLDRKKNPSNLNIRLVHGRNVDCSTPSNLLIDPKYWNKENNGFKNTVDILTKHEINLAIDNLKKEIIKNFNIDYSNGEKITSKWLKQIVANFQKRPEGIEEYKIYFSSFIEYFAKESKTRVNFKSGKIISPRTIQKYNTVKTVIEEFEKFEKIRLKITDIDLAFHKKFTSFLTTNKKYSKTVIEKNISTIKGFVKEAKEQKLETNPEAESKKFTFTRDEPIDTYLNSKEIDLIFNLDLSQDERLDNARDLFIIGLWTGLRISDLSRIQHLHFNENRIIVAETQKTGSIIEIPIHPQIKQILAKRNNQTPKTISSQKFNEYIKEVCKKAEIDQMTLGSIKNPKTNRKERGFYPKWKLISSHTARRSFATNHYGQIEDQTIMAITGHKSYTQFMKYIKTTREEHAKNLEKLWDSQNEIIVPNPTLKSVNF
ncbi:site-specific integrase [Chryseobacterium sp. Leaf405]|uniref:site-specific integrase n=1 Tax=Chryseobacterium sp. Leaf405 TaxID=1736367 RepID=UPI00161C791E|nr:site-specific integrase [Chryseobacterium sp. Leaf405]